MDSHVRGTYELSYTMPVLHFQGILLKSSHRRRNGGDEEALSIGCRARNRHFVGSMALLTQGGGWLKKKKSNPAGEDYDRGKNTSKSPFKKGAGRKTALI